MDWNTIKAEYIAGGTSYRKLAAKYNVPFNTLKTIAIKGEWVKLRERAEHNTTTKIVAEISRENAKKNAKIDEKYFKLVDKLLDKAEEVIDSTTIWQCTNLKEMASTLKYLKDCKGVKSEADMREQEARIAKLQKEAEEKEVAEDKPCGVILIPTINDTLVPPTEEDSNE